ncbi:hypothetical protein F2Q69_00020071 [Brassica cretica]|uniref:Retrotransposon gag domain-containing protein n=1 Tax=Brassica cretica TaxID=69181 RepID=A0A8S9Q3S6_BRACR|nr:hypothetical protein F2Q69_00020071 [Brassica cretica]
MPVLLKGGQCASREEAVEEMKDCRSTVHLCHRSTVMPEYGLSIFYDRLYIHMSIRSSKGIWLLLVEPLDLERVIHKSKRAVDTLQAAIGSGTVHLDTVYPPSIDTVHPPSIDTVHSTSIDTVHLTLIDIVHHSSIDIVCHDTVHRDTVHHDTVHRGTVHPMTDTTCVEKKKVEVLILKVDENGLLRDEAVKTPSRFVREDPINHIQKLEDLASRSEHNEISVDHIHCKIFPYSLSGDAFRWFRQLQPGSLICWEDITSAFFNKFIYEAAVNLEIEMRSLLEYMVEDDEQYGSGGPSRVEETDTRDPASQSIDIRPSPSIDTSTSTSIDTISSYRSTPLEIHDRSSCFRDSADSTQKSIDVSSCDLVPDVDREITMEDFLELEDEAQPENLDHNLEKKLDD